ncbi:MAG: bifunctional folylpolyglutamate synthase/dihydrofolate synthase [Spirochaetales bacterium]|nr:bifunctional folylpolyglutamate synthase/dihydrofolate synthase [Spirochaetales bacterium]
MIPCPESLNEVFSFFEGRTNLEKGLAPGAATREYRLDRMRHLGKAFGNPQDALPVLHIAGSKGKGSTAAYCASLLSEGGKQRIGIYSSPHLMDYRERFRIMGIPFPEQLALKTAQNLLQKLGDIENQLEGGEKATTFELLTLFAFLFFRDAQCDAIVLETGLGGRLDATNIVQSPQLVLLTPIEKEHTEILGKRLSQIAMEKAGIIKTGSLVFSSQQKHGVNHIFAQCCKERASTFHSLQNTLQSIQEGPIQEGFHHWTLHWKGGASDSLRLAMGGRVQAQNAALALHALQSWKWDTTRWKPNPKYLEEVRLPGRFHWVSHEPPILMDGAHTKHSIQALLEAFHSTVPGHEKPILLFGCALGKNHRAMAKILTQGKHGFQDVVVSTPGTFKPSNPPEVAQSFQKYGAKVQLIPQPQKAWERVLSLSQGNRPILVTGSFFMAGEIAKLTLLTPKGSACPR